MYQLFPVWWTKIIRTISLSTLESKPAEMFFVFFSNIVMKYCNSGLVHCNWLGSLFFKLYSPGINVLIFNFCSWKYVKFSNFVPSLRKGREAIIYLSNLILFISSKGIWDENIVRKHMVWDKRKSIQAEKGFN